MSEIEAANYLVNLFSDYERHCSKLGYSTNANYSKAVALAIMALEQTKHH